MARVEWTYDEAWDEDPVDLLGRVRLTGVGGAFIEDECTGIDVFFHGLLSVVEQLRQSSVAEHDLIIEPNPIRGERGEDGVVTLWYGDDSVAVESVDELAEALKQGVARFLEALPEGAYVDEEPLKSLRGFAS